MKDETWVDNSLLQSASEADEGISIENQFGEVNECNDDEVEVLRKEVQLLRMSENRYYRRMIKLEGAMEGLLEDNKELSLAVRQLMHENQQLQTQVRRSMDHTQLMEQVTSLLEDSVNVDFDSSKALHDSLDTILYEHQEMDSHEELKMQHEELKYMHREQQLEFEQELASYQNKLENALSELAKERIQSRNALFAGARTHVFSKSWHAAPSAEEDLFPKTFKFETKSPSVTEKLFSDANFNTKAPDITGEDLGKTLTSFAPKTSEAAHGTVVNPKTLGEPTIPTGSSRVLRRGSLVAGKAA